MTAPSLAPASNLTCIGCQSAITDRYYLAGGAKPVCAPCKSKVEGLPPGPLGPALAKAAGLGLLAAAAAAAAWAFIVIVTHLMLGIVAVAVGYVVGLAVRRGAGRHSGGVFQGLAMGLTVLSIVWSTLPMLFHAMSDRAPSAPAQVSADAPVLKVKIAENGVITVDGEPTPPDQVAGKMDALKQKNGVVWYWREHPERPSDELPPAQEAAADAVVTVVQKDKLPLKRVQDDQGTPAPEPTTSAGGHAKSLGFLVTVVPFMLYGSMVSDDPLSLFFLAIAVYEAWKLNKRRQLLFTGPFEPSSAIDFSTP